jgi:hypothetical protein
MTVFKLALRRKSYIRNKKQEKRQYSPFCTHISKASTRTTHRSGPSC